METAKKAVRRWQDEECKGKAMGGPRETLPVETFQGYESAPWAYCGLLPDTEVPQRGPTNRHVHNRLLPVAMCSHLCTLSFSSFPLLIFCFALSFLFSCTCTHPAHVLQFKWRLSYPGILRAKPGALAEWSKIHVERKYVGAVVIAFEVEIIAPGSERRYFYGCIV